MLFLHCIFAIVGMIFLYMAAFMYEDERGNQQNRLVNLWVKVKEREETSLSRQLALVRYSAQIAGLGLNRILGERLFSLWTFTVSFSLSIASGCLFFGYMISRVNVRLTPLAAGGVFLFYGLVVAPNLFKKRRGWLAICLLSSLFGIILLFMTIVPFSGHQSSLQWVIENGLFYSAFLTLPILFGVVCDVVLLAVNRLLAARMSSTTKATTLLWGALYNLLWSVFLADTLRFIFLSGEDRDPLLSFVNSFVSSFGNDKYTAELAVVLAISTNLFTLLASSLFFIVTGVAFGHRVRWPVAGRLLNALYEWKIFANKTVQLSIGLGCLVFAIPQAGTILKAFKP